MKWQKKMAFKSLHTKPIKFNFRGHLNHCTVQK
jgi:hypothetical protein